MHFVSGIYISNYEGFITVGKMLHVSPLLEQGWGFLGGVLGSRILSLVWERGNEVMLDFNALY